MANEIISALIGAGATVLAAAIPKISEIFRPLPTRQRNLMGTWEGTAAESYVESGEPAMKVTATLTFTKVSHSLKAEAILSDASTEIQKMSVIGTFHENYLQLSYRDKSNTRRQLGVGILYLTAQGNILRGYYTGFSPLRETMVAGTVILQKKS